MDHARVLGVVPARLGSERLPRKPLHPVAGRPLIEWVWRRIRSFRVFDRAVVATDSDEVADVCRAIDAPVEMTSSDHRSGTERVAEVAARPEYRGYDVVVNVQGDEPFIEESAVADAARLAAGDADIGTVAAPVRTLEAWRDPAVVKVVRDGAGRALYFSRAPIPWCRAGNPDRNDLASTRYLRHVGVYAYTADALARWVALPSTGLERIERLEQLRPLAAGLSIGVAVVDRAVEGIDTPEAARRAEQYLEAKMNSTISQRRA